MTSRARRPWNAPGSPTERKPRTSWSSTSIRSPSSPIIVAAQGQETLQAIADEISETRRPGPPALAWRVRRRRVDPRDFGDVVIHLFHEEMRRYYELENLWSDRKKCWQPGKAEPVQEEKPVNRLSIVVLAAALGGCSRR